MKATWQVSSQRIGILLLVLGVVVNVWTCAVVLTPNGRFDGTNAIRIKMLIWIYNAVMLGAGTMFLFRRSNFTVSLVKLVVATVLTTASAEVVLRIAHHHPLHFFDGVLPTVEPGGSVYLPDDLLGWSCRPGQYRVRLPSGYTFITTHLTDGSRATAPVNPVTQNSKRPEIWIFGCSLAYGWSVSDAETFCWHVQESLPQYDIRNRGVCGYGMLHAMLSYERLLHEQQRPELAVFVYGSFHDKRNVLSRERVASIVAGNRIGKINYPYASLGSNQTLCVHHKPLFQDSPPITMRSALVHVLFNFAERTYQHFVPPSETEIAQSIMRKVTDLSRSNGVRLVVVDGWGDAESEQMLAKCRAMGTVTGKIALDWQDERNLNVPHDRHPNANAHCEMASRLLKVLLDHQELLTVSADIRSQ